MGYQYGKKKMKLQHNLCNPVPYLVYASYNGPTQGSAELRDFATQFLSSSAILVQV